MNATEFAFMDRPFRARRRRSAPHEYKAVAVRPIPLPEEMREIATPDAVLRYWRFAIEAAPAFTPATESCYGIALNARNRAIGHYLIASGTLDCVILHPREVFRTAILLNAASIVLAHNHPSGDPAPSEADVRVTRELVRGGQMLKIDVDDHVIMGATHASMRELGLM